MKILELFAGSRSIGKIADKKGYEVFSLDIEQFGGIDFVGDIRNFIINDCPFIPDMIWASPPCTTFSIASCSHHRNKDYTPKTTEAEEGNDLIKCTLALIKVYKEINPNLIWYIENPRGLLRKMDFMQCIGFRYTVTYCSYGDERMKPTDIWSNKENIKFLTMCKNYRYDKFGQIINKHCHHESARRGSPTGTQGRKNAHERSKIPKKLCEFILG